MIVERGSVLTVCPGKPPQVGEVPIGRSLAASFRQGYKKGECIGRCGLSKRAILSGLGAVSKDAFGKTDRLRQAVGEVLRLGR